MDATQHSRRITWDAQQPPLMVKANGKQWLVTPDGRVEQVGSDAPVGAREWSQAAWGDRRQREEPQPSQVHPQGRRAVAAAGLGRRPWTRQVMNVRGALLRLWGPVRQALTVRTQALAGVTTASQPGRSLKETFQLGLVLGLALGCVSLVLFHQLRPNEARMDLTEEALSSTAVTAAVSQQQPFAGVVLPSVKVYVLRAGVFAGQQAAKDRLTLLQQHGWTGVLHHGQQTEVWVGTSLTKAGLSRQLDQLHKLGVAGDVVTLTWPARPIPGLTGARTSAVDLCSHWLSGAASALQALIGANADGAALADAEAAYTACKRQLPSAADWAETGQAQLFAQFVRDWDGAFQAAAQHRSAGVNSGVLHALDDLALVAQTLQSSYMG
ncbi:MAG: hypothetical protein K6T31_00855 [Alicyclobacillus sp.]|nr:hypothetical protein [Alicyclobacillus sp.]